LGRIAAKRAALIKALTDEGLVELNRKLTVAEVPLRIGLVASPGTEGYRDFIGQLDGSGFAFDLLALSVPVQGAGAPMAIARGLRAAQNADCDLIIIVRGGGSKADLAAFDTEVVARAVARSRVAVWTGIGHTGDQSVADVVANKSFVTPTECGQELVRTLEAWWGSVLARAVHIVHGSSAVIDEASRRDEHARARLVACTRSQVQRHAERLHHRSSRIAGIAPRCAEEAHLRLAQRSGRPGSLCASILDRELDRLDAWRRLISAYDVERQLERGYTLTYDEEGSLVRTTRDLHSGDVLLTRFAAGRTRSVVDDVEVEKGR
ncbi:MAG TPA: exodeoxyribonuclease VII large subunit, partial [Acidimicrobiales bacterium]|nr:exodeoxyribonuclease VII large subunit [Acidimicrobiales bacterium]